MSNVLKDPMYRFKRTRIDAVQEITVICVTMAVGEGTEEDPVRIVKQYYSQTGEFIAEYDPFEN